jgi:hypothetical protein
MKRSVLHSSSECLGIGMARETGATESLGQLDPKYDLDSLTLNVVNLGAIRCLGSLISVNFWVSGFWGAKGFDLLENPLPSRLGHCRPPCLYKP